MIDVSRERLARPLFGLVVLAMLLAPQLHAGVFDPATTHAKASSAPLHMKSLELGAAQLLDLTLESSPFVLYAGGEIGRALAANATGARDASAVAPAVDGFALDLASLESTTGPRGFSLGLESVPEPLLANPPPGDLDSALETRIGAFELTEPFRIGGERKLSLYSTWGCGLWSCENAEGVPVNLYGFVAGRPHEATDPLGLWSLQQRLGRAGERRAVELLKEEGWTVFWGGAGSHPVNSRGADVFAFNQKTQQLAFFDDKNTMFRKTVNKAKALVENFEKSQNVEAAMAAIEGSNLPETAKDELLLKLKNKDFKKFITAASGRSTVTAVGEDLEKAGVEFYDLKANAALRKAENKALVAAGEVAEQGGKTASKLGGALSVVGKGLVIAGAVSTVAHVASGDEPGEALVGIAVPIVGSLVPTRMVTTEEEMRGVYEYMYLPVLARQMAARDAQTTDLLAPSHSVTPAAVPSH